MMKSTTPSHLTLLTPGAPGTSTLSGYPWSGGRSAPFISVTSIIFELGLSAL